MFKYEKDVRESMRILTMSEKVPWTLLFIRLRLIVIYEPLLTKTLVSGYDLFTIVNSYTFVKLKAFLSVYMFLTSKKRSKQLLYVIFRMG